MEVKVTKEQGRFTVAKEDISAGTTLLVEDPLGWALENEFYLVRMKMIRQEFY